MKAILQSMLIFLGATVLRALEPDKQKPIELTTLLGETYHNAHIIKATPDAITVVHDAGVSKVSFESLGDEWKKLFHYDADKAREFQKQEEVKRQLAEENRKKAQKEYEDRISKQMAELALAENKQADNEAKLAKEQSLSLAQPPVLAPMPGDPTTNTGISRSTEIVVPATTPITQIYTPGYTRGQGSQSTIINEGTIFTSGDGRLYYINPGYGGQIYYTPSYSVPYCPPRVNFQPFHQHGTTFHIGNGSFQIWR